MLRQTLLRRTATPSRLLTLQKTPSALPSVRRIATTADPSSSSPSTPPLSSAQPPSASPAVAARPPPPRAAYLVSRTPSLNLPVYNDSKRGGNKKLTILKKIEGDARALKEALRTELGLEEGQIKINHVTGHIEIAVSTYPLLRAEERAATKADGRERASVTKHLG